MNAPMRLSREQAPAAPPQHEELARVVAALCQIGLDVRMVPGATGFLDGVRIVGGALLVAPDCRISNLIHEAGHIACVPARYRHLAYDDLDELVQVMFDDLMRLGVEPDAPLYRAVLQCSDPEATAWAWAFGVHLGLAPETVIEDYQYPDPESGEGGGEVVRLQVSMGMHFGVNGLARGGFCSTNRFGRLPVYPTLAFWTQEL
jgi:hypothetical protein